LLALAPDRARDSAGLEQDIQTSGGNPFFIHALARFSHASARSPHLPVDISVLAASSYYSLTKDTRTLLECVLYLSELSTLSRLRTVSQLTDASLLRGLRELEEEGLVRLDDGSVRCSHDLIADALRALTPQTVAAILNRRIAAHLEAECVDNRLDPTLAWAAAQAWMTAGELTAAVRLLRRCAAHAAGLGEPVEAARILGRVLDVALPYDDALLLTADLLAHSDAAGERHLHARATETRLRLLADVSIGSHSHTTEELSYLKVSYLADRLHEVDDLVPLLDQLRAILIKQDCPPAHRLQAAVTLFISADLLYDQELAHQTWREASPLFGSDPALATHALRAQLIFHTVFGEVAAAASIARQLLSNDSDSQLISRSAWSHRNALFALHALGCSEAFHLAAHAIYAYVRSRKVYSEGVYVANLIAERFLQEGNLEAAIDWSARAASDVHRIHPTGGGVTQGFYSTLAFVASAFGRWQLAERALRIVGDRLPLIRSPRLAAVDSALWMRLRLLSGGEAPSAEALACLENAHRLGKTFGRQDSIVEALWLAYRAKDQAGRASELLRDYLTSTRRERSLPEWSLRYYTREDRTWSALGYEAAPPPQVGSARIATLDSALSAALGE
jgi:hypothetical protein